MKISPHPLGTLIETDVLVIGSGASGCGAALGAREQGLDVVLLDKGKLESSGCIGGGNDHYMAVLNEKGSKFDTAEDLVKFYAKPLNGWTPAMITNGWYNHMEHMLKRLEKCGVDFSKNSDGTYKRTQGFGQPGTWWVHIANGMTIKRVMARIVRDSGVHVLDRIMAMKILSDSGKACGALGWNVVTGEYVILRAKTVVSAQGRSATRGYNNSTHNPYNVWMYPYNTGAGVVLGYDAGAAVTELDTYQRATMEPKGYGCPGMNGINSSGAHELSAIGERFMACGKTAYATTRFRVPTRNSSRATARPSTWTCAMSTLKWCTNCNTSSCPATRPPSATGRTAPAPTSSTSFWKWKSANSSSWKWKSANSSSAVPSR